MSENKHFDFMGSIVLSVASLFIILSGYGIYEKSGELMHVSPGLLPIILGVAMLLCSLLLFFSSLKDGGASKRVEEIKEWIGIIFKSETTISMLVGTVIMGVYTFVLLSILPFWLASLLFMIFLMIYLNATSIVKILILSGGGVALVVLLFQVLFRVPLP